MRIKISILTLMTIFCSRQLPAQNSIQLSGDLSTMAIFKQKPSSQKDQFFFKIPESRLGAALLFDDQIKAEIELIFAKSRVPTGERWSMQIERVYLDYTNAFTGGYFLQLGLFPQPWTEFESKLWPYRTATEHASAFSTRYGYLNRSELGFKVGQTLSPQTVWNIAICNGEGSTADEVGPKKDLHIFAQTAFDKIHLAFNWILGAYDDIDSSVAQRERAFFGLSYEQEQGLHISIIGMMAKDPVDGMNQKIADQVDLTSQGGQNISASGASLILRYNLGPKSEIFSRYDTLNPAIGVDAKGLRQSMLGFGFFPRQFLQFSLAWSDVQYEQSHASAVRDASQVAFVSRLKW